MRLALALPLIALARAAAADPCAVESLAAARTACLDLAADRVLHGIERDLGRLSAGEHGAEQGASAAALARFGRESVRAQRDWRRAMETACRDESRGAPGTAAAACRLDRARARARRDAIAALIARAYAARGLDPPPWTATGTAAEQTIDIYVPLKPPVRPGSPGGPALPALELEIPVPGAQLP